MTVIAGLIDQDGSVVIGGDSAATNSSDDQITVSSPKVFYLRNKQFIMGTSGCFRFQQIMRYALVAPKIPQGMQGFEYMATRFVNAMRQALKKNGYWRKSVSGKEIGGLSLVAFRGELYRIEDDFNIITDTMPWNAIGSGDAIARGSLYSTTDLPAHDRIKIALSAACALNAVCRPPFTILHLPKKH